MHAVHIRVEGGEVSGKAESKKSPLSTPIVVEVCASGRKTC